MMSAEKVPTRTDNTSGTIQLEGRKRLVLTSSKTSPGTAKIFRSLAASEVLGGGGGGDGAGAWGSRIGGGSSILIEGQGGGLIRAAIGENAVVEPNCPVRCRLFMRVNG